MCALTSYYWLRTARARTCPLPLLQEIWRVGAREVEDDVWKTCTSTAGVRGRWRVFPPPLPPLSALHRSSIRAWTVLSYPGKIAKPPAVQSNYCTAYLRRCYKWNMTRVAPVSAVSNWNRLMSSYSDITSGEGSIPGADAGSFWCWNLTATWGIITKKGIPPSLKRDTVKQREGLRKYCVTGGNRGWNASNLIRLHCFHGEEWGEHSGAKDHHSSI